MTERTADRISRAEFWQIRTLEHLDEMRVAKSFGLFPKKEGWRNVVEHLLVVAETSDVLAEATGASQEERKALFTATLLHDVHKRRQKRLIKLRGDEGQLQAFREQKEYLNEHGYLPYVISLTESTGHTSLIRLLKNPGAEELELKEELDLPTLIIHYADDIVSGSEIIKLDDRIDALENRGSPYPEASMGGDIFGGRTYYVVQKEVGRLIENKLASLVGTEPPSDLPNFIKAKIEERMMNG